MADLNEVSRTLNQELRRLLKEELPWLGTQEEVGGADTIEQLDHLYARLEEPEPSADRVEILDRLHNVIAQLSDKDVDRLITAAVLIYLEGK